MTWTACNTGGKWSVMFDEYLLRLIIVCWASWPAQACHLFFCILASLHVPALKVWQFTCPNTEGMSVILLCILHIEIKIDVRLELNRRKLNYWRLTNLGKELHNIQQMPFSPCHSFDGSPRRLVKIAINFCPKIRAACFHYNELHLTLLKGYFSCSFKRTNRQHLQSLHYVADYYIFVGAVNVCGTC